MKEDCLRGLLAAAENRSAGAGDFRSWILGTFGRAIAECFMLPYNAKQWAYPLEQMSSHWIGQRVAVPDVADILRRVEREEDCKEWGPNATFRYPRRGGSGAVWEAVASTLPQGRIRYGERVARVDADRRIACTAKGAEFRYDYLISSVPLDEFAAILHGSPLAPRAGNHLAERDAYFERPVSRAKRLAATATHVVGIGLEGRPPESVEDKLWIYYAEPSVPFYRVTVMSNLSAENTPRPGETWSLLAEVSESARRTVPDGAEGRDSERASVSESPAYVEGLAEEQLVQKVIDGLRTVGVVRQEDRIVSRWHRRLSHGYPVPTLDRAQILDEVLPALRDMGIYSRGRFGAWKYEVGNQDHSFMQGVEAVEHILHGRRELTLEQPELINSRYNPFPYAEWDWR